MAKNFAEAEEKVHALMKSQGLEVSDTLGDARKVVQDFNMKETMNGWIEVLEP